MREQVYVDRLFADYESTPEIKDFKEEIAANLRERVKELAASGLGEQAAFEKATAELGDITAIADGVAKKKRNEAIGQMYMNTKAPLTKKTALGFTAASALLLLGAGLALIAYFGNAAGARFYYSAVILLAAACGLFTFFGLSRETAANYPMKRGRALAYACVCIAGVLGAGLAVTSFALDGFALSAALGVKMALMLPAICALIFLLATESPRRKPWLKAMVENEIESTMRFHMDMVDPVKSAKFGIMSGGLWVLAVAIFITLGVVVGWAYSWLIFLFTLAIQVFMTTMIFKKNG